MSTHLQASQVQVVPLRTLALMAAKGSTGVLGALSKVADQSISVCDPERPTRYTFDLGGVPYSATLLQIDGGFRMHLTARLGKVPYTVEDVQSLETLRGLLSLDIADQGVQLHIARRRVLHMSQDVDVLEPPTPEAVLYETLVFIKHVRPVARLLTQYVH